jgi:hypothetical protein
VRTATATAACRTFIGTLQAGGFYLAGQRTTPKNKCHHHEFLIPNSEFSIVQRALRTLALGRTGWPAVRDGHTVAAEDDHDLVRLAVVDEGDRLRIGGDTVDFS